MTKEKDKKIIAYSPLQQTISPLEQLRYDKEICKVNYPKQLTELLRIQPATDTLEVLFVLDEMRNKDALYLIHYLQTDNGKKIKNLCVLSSRLNAEQAKAILISITRSHHMIERLSFWENYLSGDLSFLTMINKLSSSLTSLNLGDNTISGNIEHIVSIINNCPLLENLHLANTKLNDQDVKQLCVAVKDHPKLHTLSLNYNKNITNESFIYIEMLLQNNNVLQHINLFKSNIDDYKLEALQEQHQEVEIILPNNRNTSKPSLRM